MAAELATPDSGTDRAVKPGIDPESDPELVRQVTEGSQEALAGLYDRHARGVFSAAMRTSRDQWISAEVVQETFLALWDRAERFDPSRGTLPAWLQTIARNRAVDHLRADGRHHRAAAFSSFGSNDVDDHSVVEWLTESGDLIGAAGPEPAPEIALLSQETRASVEEAVASLDPLERRVIALAYESGLSQSEIAAQLGWPIGTVKTRTRRALRHLRDRLEPPTASAGARGTEAQAITSQIARSPQDGGPAVNRVERLARYSAVRSASPAPTASPCQ
jgi:RNA polymerase sigma-70 factor, ECF subfamily